MSRDDGQLGSEDEDGDDEDEVEKEAGTENDEGTEGKEDQMVVDTKLLPATDQEGSIEPAAKKQGSQEDEGGREESSQSTEDKVVQCESERVENCEQGRIKENIIDQSEHSKENKVFSEGGGETMSVNGSHIETEGNTQGQSDTLESSETNNQTQTETETEKCQAVSVADNRNGAASTEAVELNSHAEPMEVEASTTGASAAIGGDDINTGWILVLSVIQFAKINQ